MPLEQTRLLGETIQRSTTSEKSYMHEIDGVRGIALSLVVMFHLFGNGRVSGGVDVFLVISAFFLTRKLNNFFESRITTHSRQTLPWLIRHYTRVFSRLGPSAVIVLSVVLFGSFWL